MSITKEEIMYISKEESLARFQALDAGMNYFDMFGRPHYPNAGIKIRLSGVHRLVENEELEINISGSTNYFKQTITGAIIREVNYALNKSGFAGDVTVDINW